jgi:hypothetical protein
MFHHRGTVSQVVERLFRHEEGKMASMMPTCSASRRRITSPARPRPTVVPLATYYQMYAGTASDTGGTSRVGGNLYSMKASGAGSIRLLQADLRWAAARNSCSVQRQPPSPQSSVDLSNLRFALLLRFPDLVEQLGIVTARHLFAPGQNFSRGIQSADVFQQLAAFLGVQRLYRLFHSGNQTRART